MNVNVPGLRRYHPRHAASPEHFAPEPEQAPQTDPGDTAEQDIDPHADRVPLVTRQMPVTQIPSRTQLHDQAVEDLANRVTSWQRSNKTLRI